MCKSVSPSNNLANETKEQNQGTNFGLINVNSNSQTIIGPMEIIEIAGFAILCILLIRWIWKYYTKRRQRRQAKEQLRLENLVRPVAPVTVAPSVTLTTPPTLTGNYMKAFTLDQPVSVMEKEHSIMNKYR